jgi:hypothetical protein
VDDILLYSENLEQHEKLVSLVVQRLNEYNMKINIEKSRLFRTSVLALGHHITSSGIALDPRKTDFLSKMQPPVTAEEAQKFIGLVGWMQRFSPFTANLMQPWNSLRTVTRGKVKLSGEQLESFHLVKRLLTNQLLLRNFDPNKKLYLFTDASDLAIGAWLGQLNENGVIVPICCYSRSLSGTEQRYKIWKTEFLAVVEALRSFRMYLLGRKVFLMTDNKVLADFLSNNLYEKSVRRWISEISEYVLTVVWLSTEKNWFSDYLSRLRGYSVFANVVEHEETSDEKERQKLLRSFHDQLGHVGARQVLQALQNHGVHWERMKQDVFNYVSSCLVCLQNNTKPKEFHPSMASVGNAVWAHLQCDWLEMGSSDSAGKKYIFVLVDTFSNFVYLEASSDKSVDSAAQILWRASSLFGFPQSIQSGSELAAKLVTYFCEVFHIAIQIDTPYHSESHGLVERYNRFVVALMRKLTKNVFSHWSKHVPMINYIINLVERRKTAGLSAFAVMFNRFSINPYHSVKLDAISGADPMEALVEYYEKIRTELLPTLASSVATYAHTQSWLLDQRRSVSEEALPPGTLVLVKNTERQNKQEAANLGPFKVKKQLDGTSYVLESAAGDELRYNRNQLVRVNIPNPIVELQESGHVVQQQQLEEMMEESAQRDATDEHANDSKSKKSSKSKSKKKSKRQRKSKDDKFREEGEEEGEDTRFYNVSEIIEHRKVNGKLQYLVKWAGYRGAPSWEPEENFGHPRTKLNKYKLLHKL